MSAEDLIDFKNDGAVPGKCPVAQYTGKCTADPGFEIFYATSVSMAQAKSDCDLQAGIFAAYVNPKPYLPGDWVFKDDQADKNICFQIRGDQVTSTYLATLINNGAMPGQCPAKNYAAHCEYLGENNSESMMWFYPELPVADARATCGANGGTYFDADGTATGGPIKAPPGTPANPTFTLPAWRMVFTTSGAAATCTEIETTFITNPTFRIPYLKNAGLTEGECPTKAYIGLCHHPIIENVTDIAMKDYWLDAGVETANANALKSSCENSGGVWTTY